MQIISIFQHHSFRRLRSNVEIPLLILLVDEVKIFNIKYLHEIDIINIRRSVQYICSFFIIIFLIVLLLPRQTALPRTYIRLGGNYIAFIKPFNVYGQCEIERKLYPDRFKITA